MKYEVERTREGNRIFEEEVMETKIIILPLQQLQATHFTTLLFSVSLIL
jgi:hypothetical protein